MERANHLNRRLLTLISLTLSLTILAVVAIPTSWFEAAKITGVVVKTESNTVKAIIDLGNLSSATPFSASGNGAITIDETGGLKIGNFMMGFPEYTPEEGYVYERYLTSRFYKLWLNFTIGATKITMPIVRDGTFNPYYNYTYYWSSEFYENQWRYYRYSPWSAITLPKGTYTTTFTIFGTTTLTTKSLGVEMMFYFVLTPP